MLPELGTFAIILALVLALIQTVSGLRFFPKTLPQVSAIGQCGFLGLAMILLMASFLQNDFTVIYVQSHSHPTLPLLYRIGAAWGGHEGSLLLWSLVLAGWTCLFATVGHASLSRAFQVRVLSILGIISIGFLLFLLLTSNPFWRNFPLETPAGEDLTPVLQDPGLIFHPPMLYCGYVGFAIAFAFAVALLLGREKEPFWARTLRSWVVLPWMLLGCGIVLGSWWSYRELGWGGWWFWDPVENASLLPWLSATALLHNLIMTEKREGFAGLSLFLALLTFSLSLIGTFLVRSGVLVSVHAFAADPTRGIFLLAWLAFLMGASFLLYAFRIGQFRHALRFSLVSRETLLQVHAVLLLTAVVILLLGTLYPIVLDALQGTKISVGEPYYTTLFTPLMFVMLGFMVFAPNLRWGEDRLFSWQKTGLPTIAGCIAATLPWLAGYTFYLSTSFGLFVSGAMLYATLAAQFRKPKLSAMLLSHAGIAFAAIGIILNLSYSTETQVRMSPHETLHFAGHDFYFAKETTLSASNFDEIQAEFLISKNHHDAGSLAAKIRIYTSHNEVLSHPGIHFNAFRDLYVAPGNRYRDGSWALRFYYRPFVRWIWAGGLIAVASGIFSLLKRRKPTT